MFITIVKISIIEYKVFSIAYIIPNFYLIHTLSHDFNHINRLTKHTPTKTMTKKNEKIQVRKILNIILIIIIKRTKSEGLL